MSLSQVPPLPHYGPTLHSLLRHQGTTTNAVLNFRDSAEIVAVDTPSVNGGMVGEESREGRSLFTQWASLEPDSSVVFTHLKSRPYSIAEAVKARSTFIFEPEVNIEAEFEGGIYPLRIQRRVLSESEVSLRISEVPRREPKHIILADAAYDDDVE